MSVRSVFGPAVASLLPVVCLGAACLWGGAWVFVGVISITLTVFVMDKLLGSDGQGDSEATGHWLSSVLGVVHFGFLGLTVWALAAQNDLTGLEKSLIFLGVGLWMGQVSNSNAHELIHRSARWPRRLGVLVYASLMFGHHASAHPKVHHIYAATAKDPNTARLGEGFYAYFLRAWFGGFIAGWRAENIARARASKELARWRHPYVGYVLASGLSLWIAFWGVGAWGVAVLVALSLYAQVQLMLSDYVQHYGLERHILADARPEPFGPQHAWNAPFRYSSALMLNAPRHSDHHLRPARAFPALEVDDAKMPILPHSLPMMACVALVPWFWHQIMDHRAKSWAYREFSPKRARDTLPQGIEATRESRNPRAKMPNWAYENAIDTDPRARNDSADVSGPPHNGAGRTNDGSAV